MYQGKRKNKRWTIQEKNEIVLLYLDQHMGWNEILRTFNIPGDGMLQRWIEQYRKFGTCVDNRGKATHLDNPSKGSCVDNVPIESFFSILKSECIYLKQNLQKEEIEEVVKNFIMYYNNERLQEKIQELAPMQFRKQAVASLSF